jgi:hypothetical protein
MKLIAMIITATLSVVAAIAILMMKREKDFPPANANRLAMK